MNTTPSLITWEDAGQTCEAAWRSPTQRMPSELVPADDTLSADKAYKLVNAGKGLLWRGDFHNGRQLLQALSRRLDRKPRRRKPVAGATDVDTPTDALSATRAAFMRHRAFQARRAEVLGRVLIRFEPDHSLSLRRAPDARTALTEAWGAPDGHASMVSMRDLQGMIGAHEWRKKGVDIPFLNDRIHPHYGVYSPLRGEYIDLIAHAPLPDGAKTLAFDIGTGSGVIAAVLAKRGVARVLASDISPAAIACASQNIARLGYQAQVELLATDLFPEGRAPLIVCNPPWLPVPASAAIERAVYDPDSAMLRAFLTGLCAHLTPNGEGWLVMSDLAEHLGLRGPSTLTDWMGAAGLRVLARHDARPSHPKATDPSDPLFVARRKEVTTLWRLAAA
jgi:methylase of polypeptide subunit release factors